MLELKTQTPSALFSNKGMVFMSFQISPEQTFANGSQTNEDVESILDSLAFDETCMANEIYVCAQRLKTALSADNLNSTAGPVFVENLNRLDLSNEDIISTIIQKELLAIGKIEKALGQSLNSDDAEKLKEANKCSQVEEPLKT